MPNYQGKIAKVYPSRFGGGSFGLEGQSGLYFNTKSPLPAFACAGATVAFDGEIGRNGKSVFVTDASLKAVSGPAPAASSGGGGGFASTDQSIKYQSSRKDALVMVGLLAAAGVLYTDKTPKAKIAGILEDAVDRFTACYFDDIENLGALERNPPGEPAAAPKAAEPAEEIPE